MTFTETIAPLLNQIMTSIPSLLFGVLILLAGYIVAKLGAAIVRRLLARTTVDTRISELLGLRPPLGPGSVQATIGQIAFWIIMFLALIGFFNQVGLPLVAEPLRSMMERITSAAPRFLEAGLVIVVAWIVAALLRFLVTRALTALDVDRRFGRYLTPEGAAPPAIPQTLGTLVFYVVLLVAVPPFLAALGQSAIVDPLVQMLGVVLNYLPNLVAAALTIAAGWVVARILREVVRNLLAAAGLDRAVERAGLAQPMGEVRLSSFIGTVVYFVVWVPFIVAGLDALKIEAVSGPAISALNALLAWVPKGLGALVILVLAWVISRFLGNLVAELFRGIGFDTLPARLGLAAMPATVGGRGLSDLAGFVVTVFVLLFALIEAFEVMGLTQFAAFGGRLIAFVVNVVIAAVIVGVGLWVGNFLQGLLNDALQRAGSAHARLIGVAAKYTVAIFALTMALQQIGFGETIVVTAFGLLFGAVCLALALAFGLGARDAAARVVERSLMEGGGSAR